MARILSISYDPTLSRIRRLLLEKLGHSVTSAEGFKEAIELCDQEAGAFDLMVLGHSIPHDDKRAIISHCTQTCPCPVLALTLINEPPVIEAVRSIDPSDTRAFLAAVQELLARSKGDHAP